MASLAAVNEQLQINNENNMAGHELTAGAIEKLTSITQSFVNMMKMQQLDNLEMMREQRASQNSQVQGGSGAGAGPNPGSLLPIIGGIAALAVGFFQGIIDSAKKLLNLARLDKPLARLFDTVSDFFRAIGKTFRTRFATLNARTMAVIGPAIEDTVKIFKDIGRFLKASFAGTLLTGIINFIKFPIDGLVTGPEGGIFARIMKAITAPFKMIMDTVKATFGAISDMPGVQALKTAGRVIGRLFAPFAVLITLYDTVKGAIEGFNEDGFIGGVFGAIKGLLTSVVGAPLDLLKKAVSFILDKLGFDNAAEALRGFSFQDIISRMVNSVMNGLKMVINAFIDGIAKMVSYISDDAADKIRSFKFDTTPDVGSMEGEDLSRETARRRKVADDLSQQIIQARKDGKKPEEIARLEAKRQEALISYGQARDRVAAVETSRNELADSASTSGSTVADMSDNSSVVNNNVSNSQAIVAPVPSPAERDPYSGLLGAR